MRLAIVRFGSRLEHDSELYAGVGRGVDHSIRLAYRHGDWLFTQNVEPTFDRVQGKGGDLRGFGWWGGGAHFETLMTPNSPLPDKTEQSCTPSVRLNPPCANRVPGNATQEESIAARSRHPSGVSSVQCDGSVRFFLNNVNLDTWRAWGTAAGNDAISAD